VAIQARAMPLSLFTDIVVRLKGKPGFTGRAPGGPSRWSTRRTDE